MQSCGAKNMHTYPQAINQSQGGFHDRHHHTRRPDRQPGAPQTCWIAGEELRVIVRGPVDIPAGGPEGPLTSSKALHGDAAVVDKAFSGADARLLADTAGSGEAPFGRGRPSSASRRPAAEAFSKHGVGRGRRSLRRSALAGATPCGPPGPGYVHRLSRDGRPDPRPARSRLPRALTNPSFMDNTIRQGPVDHRTRAYPSRRYRRATASLPTVATPRKHRPPACQRAACSSTQSWSGVGEVPSLRT